MRTFDLAKRERQFMHCLSGLLGGLLSWGDVVDYMPLKCRRYQRHIVRMPHGARLDTDVIIDLVVAEHSLTRQELIAPGRSYRLIPARQHLYFRLLTECSVPMAQICDAANRDRTTIVHGARAHAARNGLLFQGSYWRLREGSGSKTARADAPAVPS